MSHRTQITLTDDQYESLKSESKRTGLGLAELVRRALVTLYGHGRKQDPEKVLAESYGAWADRSFDGQSYVEDLRRGLGSRLLE